jgi:hypothetical protein
VPYALEDGAVRYEELRIACAGIVEGGGDSHLRRAVRDGKETMWDSNQKAELVTFMQILNYVSSVLIGEEVGKQ